MPAFVADASAVLPWCFEDEATSWTDSLLDRLRGGDRISVPAHWPAEISNGLLAALRRQRIRPGQPEEFWDELAALPIDVELPLSPEQAKAVLVLAREHRISFYDAVYLELAMRRGFPLATLDAALAVAAAADGVALLAPSAI